MRLCGVGGHTPACQELISLSPPLRSPRGITPTTLTSRGIPRARIINEVARDPIDTVPQRSGIGCGNVGNRNCYLVTGASGGGMSCRDPSHNMTWGNNESVETSLSGGRENMCGRKKFNFVRFGVTKSSALALSLSRISEGPDKQLIFLERLMIVFAYRLFPIPAIF
jgi:hypothetical protein